MENAEFLFTAYGVVWAVVFGYVLFLLSQQKKLRRDLDSLKEMIKERQVE